MGVYNTKLFYPPSQITDERERKKNDSTSLTFSINHLPIMLFIQTFQHRTLLLLSAHHRLQMYLLHSRILCYL
jgi:hypothetical protein